jgi:L-threonylcarbamoyladenylate synthase
MPADSAVTTEQAAGVLRQGGVVAYPTESCFGLGCDPRNNAAIRRILKMKRRSRDKGLILISDRIERLLPYLATLAPPVLDRLRESWPGPVTWLCPASALATQWLRGVHPTLAVRVTAHPPAARLCREAGMPLVSTSANLAGRQALRTVSSVSRTFGDAVDAIVDEPIGRRTQPSRIVDALSGRTLRP